MAYCGLLVVLEDNGCVVTEMYKSAEDIAGLLQHLCQTDRSFVRCKKQCGNHVHCCL